MQVDEVNPKKFQLLEGYRDPDNNHIDARLFTILIRHWESKMAWDVENLTEIKIFQFDTHNKIFLRKYNLKIDTTTGSDFHEVYN